MNTFNHFTDNFYVTVGCHPTRCDEFDKADSPEAYLNGLKDVIEKNRPKVVAIGECGLDNQRLHFCSSSIQEKYSSIKYNLLSMFSCYN